MNYATYIYIYIYIYILQNKNVKCLDFFEKHHISNNFQILECILALWVYFVYLVIFGYI